MSDISIRAFARLLKVSEAAVRKGIKAGRLVRSIGRNGKIADGALAKQEWRANAAKPGKGSAVTLIDVQKAVGLERARGLRLANDERRGRLIPADQATREAFEAARIIRDSVLNLPARLSAELAAETDAARVHVRLEAELRLALESAATRLHG